MFNRPPTHEINDSPVTGAKTVTSPIKCRPCQAVDAYSQPVARAGTQNHVADSGQDLSAQPGAACSAGYGRHEVSAAAPLADAVPAAQLGNAVLLP
jgi:hypothetical protein